MEKIFQIGNFGFRLCYEKRIKIPPAFLKFEKADGVAEYVYEIEIMAELPLPEGKVIARRPDLMVLDSEGLESRLIGIKGSLEYYACYQEIAENRAKVRLCEDKIEGLSIDPVFSSLLALERRMLAHNGLILHCAYLRYEGEAILFSAPSGVGKSTQARLWEQYRQSETINGDRSLLQKVNGRWKAQGWPVSGTSGVCKNIASPIKAIVVLGQSVENQIRRMKGAEVFRELYAQITVNYWNVPAVQKSLDLLEDITAEVPVYHLDCNISENAVICLEKALNEVNGTV